MIALATLLLGAVGAQSLTALIPVIVAIAAGQSPAVVGVAFTTLSLGQMAQIAGTLLKVTPDLVELFETIHPALEGLAEKVKSDISTIALATFMSEGFRVWVAANGADAIKMQEQRDANH